MVDEQVLEELRASVGDDTSFLRDLIEAYLTDSAEQLAAIEAAVAADDAEALVRPAHTLKSSSATVGAMELSALARTLEMAGRDGTLGDAESAAAAQRLRSTSDTTVAGLRAWMSEAAADD
jgi:HPt (histidine-containing phosphotransfer) domain-containing protein